MMEMRNVTPAAHQHLPYPHGIQFAVQPIYCKRSHSVFMQVQASAYSTHVYIKPYKHIKNSSLLGQ